MSYDDLIEQVKIEFKKLDKDDYETVLKCILLLKEIAGYTNTLAIKDTLSELVKIRDRHLEDEKIAQAPFAGEMWLFDR